MPYGDEKKRSPTVGEVGMYGWYVIRERSHRCLALARPLGSLAGARDEASTLADCAASGPSSVVKAWREMLHNRRRITAGLACRAWRHRRREMSRREALRGAADGSRATRRRRTSQRSGGVELLSWLRLNQARNGEMNAAARHENESIGLMLTRRARAGGIAQRYCA